MGGFPARLTRHVYLGLLVACESSHAAGTFGGSDRNRRASDGARVRLLLLIELDRVITTRLGVFVEVKCMQPPVLDLELRGQGDVHQAA